MNRKAITLLIIIGISIVIAVPSTFAPAEAPPKPTLEGSSDFGDGIMMIYVVWTPGIEAQGELQALSDAKLVRLGDRYFLRGKAVIMKEAPTYEKYKMLDGTDVGYDWRNIVRFHVVPRDVFDAHIKAMTAAE